MNPGASAGRIPAKLSVAARASVTAGLANDVDDVNQYAAVMKAATANGVAAGRDREQPQITDTSPKVAVNSPASWPSPARTWRDAENTGASNIRCARATPANAPRSWATTYAP